MLNLTDSSYKKLTSTERFNLAIAAFSRGDQEEIARLKRTCPNKHYTMMDYEYTSRVSALVWVITQFSEMCEFSHNKIILCESCVTICTSLIKKPQRMSVAIKSNVVDLINAKMKHISHLKSAYQALSEFCFENKLNYDQIIEWLKISPELISQYDNYRKSSVEYNQEHKEFVKQKLYSVWQSYVTS